MTTLRVPAIRQLAEQSFSDEGDRIAFISAFKPTPYVDVPTVHLGHSPLAYEIMLACKHAKRDRYFHDPAAIRLIYDFICQP